MSHPFIRKSLLALLVAASFPAFAASYYVVAPLPGKKVLNNAISVTLNSSSAPTGLVGQPYPGLDLRPLLSVTGDPDYSGYGVKWQVVAGRLPAGLTLNSNGTISGTPTAAESASVTVRATYKTMAGEQTYQVVALNITVALSAAGLPAGVTGNAYPGFDFKSVLTVSGDAAYTPGAATWSLVSGTLPAGLTLSQDGVVTGTPSAPANSAFTLAATYRNKSDQRSYSLQVDAAQVTGALAAVSDTNYGTVTVGSSAQRTFTLTTQGNTSATGVYASASGDGMTITSSTCGTVAAPVTLTKGGSCQFTARYAPTLAGAMSGTVAVNWAGPAADRKSLSVNGDAKVDYSSLMSGYTADAIAIGRNTAWGEGLQWYWRVADAQVTAPAGTFEFRRTVTIAGSVPVTASLYGSVDDSVARFSVNGTTVFTARSMPFSTYSSSPAFTLQPGVNVIAIQVTNSGTNANPAGLALQVQGADGAVIVPESGWRFQP
jgi:hypothetical protein